MKSGQVLRLSFYSKRDASALYLGGNLTLVLGLRGCLGLVLGDCALGLFPLSWACALSLS